MLVCAALIFSIKRPSMEPCQSSGYSHSAGREIDFPPGAAGIHCSGTIYNWCPGTVADIQPLELQFQLKDIAWVVTCQRIKNTQVQPG